MSNDTIDFTTKPCPRCKGTAVLKLPVEGAKRYNQGELVQNAFPEMPAADRERLVTGYCGTCWDLLFPEEDEEEYDPEDETTDCPDHGMQKVVKEGSTGGSDPYTILHLACGHAVVCMGPGDPNTIIGGK